MKTGYVYITANKNRTTFYVGTTNNLRRRIFEHRTGQSNFTSKYNVYDLMYFEEIHGMKKVIAREKQLKNWHREWKLNLIREKNPDMVNLSEGWFTEEQIQEEKRKVRETLTLKRVQGGSNTKDKSN